MLIWTTEFSLYILVKWIYAKTSLTAHDNWFRSHDQLVPLWVFFRSALLFSRLFRCILTVHLLD